MSAVIAVPELMAGAATDLASIGSTLNAAHLTAAPPTLAVLPAAADEVSTAVAHLFSQHAQDYQALAGQATAFHDAVCAAPDREHGIVRRRRGRQRRGVAAF